MAAIAPLLHRLKTECPRFVYFSRAMMRFVMIVALDLRSAFSGAP
jgi:hypothetical protein